MAIAYESFLSSLRTRDIENNMQLIINNILSLIPDGKKKAEEAVQARLVVSYALRYGKKERKMDFY